MWYSGGARLAAHSKVFLNKTKGESLVHSIFAKYRINPKNEGFIVDNLATLKEICETINRAGDYDL